MDHEEANWDTKGGVSGTQLSLFKLSLVKFWETSVKGGAPLIILITCPHTHCSSKLRFPNLKTWARYKADYQVAMKTQLRLFRHVFSKVQGAGSTVNLYCKLGLVSNFETTS